MPKFVRGDAVVEAIQLRTANKEVLLARFTPNDLTPLTIMSREDTGEVLYAEIQTEVGIRRVHIGDWVVKDPEGKLYPCAPGVFDMVYYPAG